MITIKYRTVQVSVEISYGETPCRNAIGEFPQKTLNLALVTLIRRIHVLDFLIIPGPLNDSFLCFICKEKEIDIKIDVLEVNQ